MNLIYETINEKHIDSAVNLVIDAYNEEKESTPYLPEGQQFVDALYQSISRLFNKRTGIAALLDGKLVGFIAGFRVNELWGRCKGIYSPLYGHGAAKQNRSKIYQQLYKHAADLWVKENITSYALTFFAHDEETIDTWFWLGFGLRCVDSIRQAAPLDTVKSDISIKKIVQNELSELAEVHRSLNLHLRNSPMFMPREDEDPIEDLKQWHRADNRHIWAAYKDDKVVGYMGIEEAAETFISEHPDVMNITRAYVLDSERNSGIASLLLDAVQSWLLENGYPLCGVDFESFNIVGSRFWNKYFTPYTYSLTRRIDERIL